MYCCRCHSCVCVCICDCILERVCVSSSSPMAVLPVRYVRVPISSFRLRNVFMWEIVRERVRNLLRSRRFAHIATMEYYYVLMHMGREKDAVLCAKPFRFSIRISFDGGAMWAQVAIDKLCIYAERREHLLVWLEVGNFSVLNGVMRVCVCIGGTVSAQHDKRLSSIELYHFSTHLYAWPRGTCIKPLKEMNNVGGDGDDVVVFVVGSDGNENHKQ